MTDSEWTYVDKSAWPRGEWDGEPDKKQWTDPATGLPCLIVRNPGGALCGYVGVSAGHPAFEKNWDAVNVDVHGGLTFADKCADMSREAWERARKVFADSRAEAEKFPQGDSAERIRAWSPVIDSYEAWVEKMQGRAICHLVQPGDDDNVWWLGFDCSHCGDVTPKYDGRYPRFERDANYKSIGYVTRQVESLAAQLKAMS